MYESGFFDENSDKNISIVTVMNEFDIAVSEADGGIDMGVPVFEHQNKQIYELQGCYKKCYSTDVSLIYNVSILYNFRIRASKDSIFF